MAKNNKGFSLIEIVIAIAVLTLLLTPIIEQFAQTMRTSRLAKEQQYINEEAVYALEEAQVTPEKELDMIYQNLSAGEGLPYSTSTDVVTCSLVDLSGTELASVNYNVDTYKIENIEIGARNTLYNKTIKIDDLSAQVKGQANPATSTASDAGFSIAYNLGKGNLSTMPEGYTLTNEGSIVKYDSNGNITNVVCVPDYLSGNPNEANLGNMQNLDLNTVAMINGTGATFDSQAETALYALALEKLKEIDYESWKQAIFHTGDDSVLNQYNYSNAVKKVTKVYVDKLSEASKDYYLVSVDVYYLSQFSLTVVDEKTNLPKTYPFSEQLKYNVFSQKFYMDKCPDIYFEYQPYISDIAADNTVLGYAEDDYILMDCYVEGVKLYLYKPFKDALSVSNSITDSEYKQGTYVYTTEFADAATRANETTLAAHNQSHAVKIHMTKMNNNVKDVLIYTNLDITPNLQFYCDDTLYSTAPYDGILSDNTVGSSITNKEAYDVNYIKSLSDDVRYDNRLKTVTVTMAPVSANTNTVVLTGAKGEK